MHKLSFAEQKGVSLYLAFMVMSVLLAIGLGVSVIFVPQIKTIKGMGDSVIAFYAADTALERVLYALQKEGYIPQSGEEPCDSSFECPALSNGAFYKIKILQADGILIIASKGQYRDTIRALQIAIQ